MGTDIHLSIEYKKNDDWFLYARDVEAPRRYDIFNCLAGVRDTTAKHIAPRGLPKNVSYEVGASFERWGVDAHTASYLSLSELQDVISDLIADDFFYALIINIMEQIEGKFRYKTRVVFWFDN